MNDVFIALNLHGAISALVNKFYVCVEKYVETTKCERNVPRLSKNLNHKIKNLYMNHIYIVIFNITDLIMMSSFW
jgi:hypothetical protein